MEARPWTRPVIATALVAVAITGQALAVHLYGDARTPPAALDQLRRSGAAQVAVTMAFAPEQFNLTFLQSEGTIVRASGDTIYLTGVSGGALNAIAGQYWVSRVRDWNGK